MTRLQIIILAIFVTIPLCAQKPLENDEIFATVGVNTPRVLWEKLVQVADLILARQH